MKTAFNQPESSYFDVLHHSDALFIIQTQAGMPLTMPNETDLVSLVTEKIDANGFGRFNIALHVGDNPHTVLQNRGHLLSAINQYLSQSAFKLCQPPEIKSIHWLNQIHGNHVIKVTTQIPALIAPNGDAQISTLKGTALAAMTADCVPIALYDPITKQIAVIHAGWQGLANGIIAVTINNLKQNVQTAQESNHHDSMSTDNVNQAQSSYQAWIGACISPACYEVGEDVVEKLLAGCQQQELDMDYIKAHILGAHTEDHKYWLDLPQLAAIQLRNLGIMVNTFSNNERCPKDVSTLDVDNLAADNPVIMPISNKQHRIAYGCSYTDPRYYSHRRKTHCQQDSMGRMALLIMRLS